jgi:hypothetical protein
MSVLDMSMGRKAEQQMPMWLVGAFPALIEKRVVAGGEKRLATLRKAE